MLWMFTQTWVRFITRTVWIHNSLRINCWSKQCPRNQSLPMVGKFLGPSWTCGKIFVQYLYFFLFLQRTNNLLAGQNWVTWHKFCIHVLEHTTPCTHETSTSVHTIQKMQWSADGGYHVYGLVTQPEGEAMPSHLWCTCIRLAYQAAINEAVPVFMVVWHK